MGPSLALSLSLSLTFALLAGGVLGFSPRGFRAPQLQLQREQGGRRTTRLWAEAEPSYEELSAAIRALQGQVEQLASMVGDLAKKEGVNGAAVNGSKAPAAMAAIGVQVEKKLAGTPDASPPGVELVPVSSAQARIDAFMRGRSGGGAVAPAEAAAAAPMSAPPAQASPAPGGHGYALTIDWDGKKYDLRCAEDQTVLDAAVDAGLDLPHSCMSGSCLTCPGIIRSGSVDQSDGILEPEQLAKGYMLTCVSYPKSDLEVEIIHEDDLP